MTKVGFICYFLIGLEINTFDTEAHKMNLSTIQAPRIIPLPVPYKFHTMDVLRLDEVHPVISGNKWFKLVKYFSEAKASNRKWVATYGGAYSNHIVATAAAAQQYGLQSIGMIRGEIPKQLSPTLMEAQRYGMQLLFLSRTEYAEKIIPSALCSLTHPDDVSIIPEGGYGSAGAAGIAEMLASYPVSEYDYLFVATGTGTTLAGIAMSTQHEQEVWGISVLKNNFSIEDEINHLLPGVKKNKFKINYDYHFGGYAKYNEALIVFMNEWFESTGIPTDFVYTAKLFFAVHEMILSDTIKRGSRILVIHTGGLQGNRSLPKGTLIF
jgi:1-aminocyclopropane-1-carboxylate deaminase